MHSFLFLSSQKDVFFLLAIDFLLGEHWGWSMRATQTHLGRLNNALCLSQLKSVNQLLICNLERYACLDTQVLNLIVYFV